MWTAQWGDSLVRTRDIAPSSQEKLADDFVQRSDLAATDHLDRNRVHALLGFRKLKTQILLVDRLGVKERNAPG